MDLSPKRLRDFWKEFSIFQVKYEFSADQTIKSEEGSRDEPFQCKLSAFEIWSGDIPLFCLKKDIEKHITLSLNLNELIRLFSFHKSGIWESIRIEQDVIKKTLNNVDFSNDISHYSQILGKKYESEIKKVQEFNFSEDFTVKLGEGLKQKNDDESQLKAQIKSKKESIKILKEKFSETENKKTENQIDQLEKELKDLEHDLDEIIRRKEEEKNLIINRQIQEAQSHHKRNKKEKGEEDDSAIQIIGEEEKRERLYLGLNGEIERRDYYARKIISSLSRILFNKFETIIKNLEFSQEAGLWNVSIQGKDRAIIDFITPSESSDNWGLKDALRIGSEGMEIEIASSTIIEFLKSDSEWEERELNFLKEAFAEKKVSDIFRFEELDNILFKEIVRKLSPLIKSLREKIPFRACLEA